ncbi:dihydroxyacetone kinase family protein [Robbsia sp. KACC 23696]|uniref:dihydroxyacetone kinase family protein n=1 Tax=Robbsia sp. KACC 23696 TaxID=3149231 RepID=UPI00325B9BA2
MKKLINHADTVVRDMLEGIARQRPHTAILGDDNILVRTDLPSGPDRPVAIISGGGSGHEPAHAGYVGEGMLSAAVCGEVFTSPSTDAVLAAIIATAGPKGAVLVVKNYTGDKLNFGLAAELARAEGIPVEIVSVADDVSLRADTHENRRRGIAGTVLIHKIAGAAAARGLTLEEVATLAREAAAVLGTMGVALSGCTMPGADKASFTLAEDEIELGLGIHGEKGVRRVAPMTSRALAETLVSNIVEALQLESGASVALLVNGLGATPQMELDIVLRDAYDEVVKRGMSVTRAWSGTLLSALDMAGCSISLMRTDDARLALLDAATTARAWPGAGDTNDTIRLPSPTLPSSTAPAADSADARRWIAAIRPALSAVSKTLLDNEPRLTELDSLSGDGDLGASMTRAAHAIDAVDDAVLTSPAAALAGLSLALRKAIAGSSGPFYATALMRAARCLQQGDSPRDVDWANAFKQAVAAIGELGGAKAGDRTMLDSLIPASDTFAARLQAGDDVNAAWRAAVDAAEQGAEATAQMSPRAGRASYLGDRAKGAPDGGAAAVWMWLRALTPFIGPR